MQFFPATGLVNEFAIKALTVRVYRNHIFFQCLILPLARLYRITLNYREQ
jgi:hypothetical protein